METEHSQSTSAASFNGHTASSSVGPSNHAGSSTSAGPSTSASPNRSHNQSKFIESLALTLVNDRKPMPPPGTMAAPA